MTQHLEWPTPPAKMWNYLQITLNQWFTSNPTYVTKDLQE
jgi:hypothetical protein